MRQSSSLVRMINLVMFQTYTHDFQCIFDLKRYPFDTQTCSVDLAMGPLDEASVILIPNQLHMKQKLEMSNFEIMMGGLKMRHTALRRGL